MEKNNKIKKYIEKLYKSKTGIRTRFNKVYYPIKKRKNTNCQNCYFYNFGWELNLISSGCKYFSDFDYCIPVRDNSYISEFDADVLLAKFEKIRRA